MGLYHQHDRVCRFDGLYDLRSWYVSSPISQGMHISPFSIPLFRVFCVRLNSELIISTVYLAITGIENVEKTGSVTVGNVFGNKIFRNIVLSLAATYGLYILASLLALDPWHMSGS